MKWEYVENATDANDKVKELFYTLSSPSTVVYLSGGKTSNRLYQELSEEALFRPTCVAMVDERYGKKWHEESNELMMKESGLLKYLKKNNIPFHPILNSRHPGAKAIGSSSEEILSRSMPLQNDDLRRCADEYDQTLRQLQATYRTHIALLGIGADGHIAGIAPNRKDFDNPLFTEKNLLASNYIDERYFGARVTMTFHGLSLMDQIIVLVLGDEKKKALQLMMKSGSEEEIPARFLTLDDIPVTIITDQQI